jgi:hypothetical protein
MATLLNAEGFRNTRGGCFSGKVVWLLRQQWQVPTVKDNGNDNNPRHGGDRRYSVEGVAKVVGVTLGTVYKWLRKGLVKGQQLTKGMPWKISLTDQEMRSLRAYVQRVRRLKRAKTQTG